MTHFYKRAALFILAAVTLASPLARAADQPNILFIFSDDHAYQSIGAYGSKINKTPNIDRIAKEGMLFERCYVTNSICGPVRAVIQTGKYSHINGFLVNGNKFDGHQQTFPKIMQKSGYQTAVVGKWHLGTHMPPQGYDYAEVLKGQGPYYNPEMLKHGELQKHIGYTTEVITELALNWLENERDQSKPFILMAQHKAPHRNWQPGPNEINNYNDVMVPEPETLFDDYANRASPARTQDMSIEKTMNPNDLKLTKPRGLTPEQESIWNQAYGPKNAKFEKANLTGRDLVRWKYQRYIKDYLRTIDAVDKSVGQLLKYLDDNGLAENTVVIYSADQGFYLGEHGWFDKRWMYEESLRTPLIVKWPGVVKPGTRNEKDIVSNLDYAQTFLDIAGAKIPGDMQGASIVPVLKGKTPSDWRKDFYYHYYEFPGAHSVQRHYGVTTGRYKLINYYEMKEWELFDLQADPNELKSVYGTPEYARIQRKLEGRLAEMRKEYDLPEEDPEQTRTDRGRLPASMLKDGAEAEAPKKGRRNRK